MSPHNLRFSLRPLALAIPLALSAGLGLWPAGLVHAEQQLIRYDIPAGPLASQLNRFAAQSGIYLAGDAALTTGKTSQALHGSYGVEQALQILLDDSGLTAQAIGNGRYELNLAVDQSSALQLGATTVSGRQENAWGQVDGYVATRSGSGTKTDTPISEIPQTINVVTADEISARGATSIAQALNYTPGVSSSGFTQSHMLADEMSSRGFAPAPLYLDGAYLPYAGSLGGAPQIEPYSLERVEVLKGPASVMFGQNQPGGIVNMVSKKPTGEKRHEVRLGVASHDRINGALDVGGPLASDDDSVLYRVLALANSGNEQIDYTESQRLFIAPSLTWNLSNASAITVYLQAQRDDAVPDYQPLPMIGTLKRGTNGKRIDRDFFQGEPGYNDYMREQYIFGLNFSHQFSDDLQLRQSLRYVDVNDDYQGFYLRWYANPEMTTATRNKLDWEQRNNTLSIDNNLELKIDTGALEHTLLAGVDYRRFSRKYDGYNNYYAEPIDLYDPDYGVISDNPVMDYQWDNTVNQTGLYFQDQIRWNDLILTLGGRQDWAGLNNKDLLADTHTTRDDEALTGRVGVTWLAGNGIAPYLSYSESFLPVVGSDYSGKAFEPTTGKQLEAGIKYQPEGQRSLLTFSVFEIKQQNMETEDLAHPGFSIQAGEVRSQGAELEAKAQITEALNIIAGVSYLNTRITNSNYGDEGKQVVGQAPWSGSLWADYHFATGVFDGLGLGAGMRWTGKQYADADNDMTTPSYAVFDAAVRYDLGRVDTSLRGTEVSLNAQNLFDRTYVSSCNWELGCYYGKARTLKAEVAYRW